MRPLLLEPEYRNVLITESVFTTGSRISLNGHLVWGGDVPGVTSLLEAGVTSLLEDRARWGLPGPTSHWRRSL